MRLVLASQSPRRADLLRQAGYAFIIHPVDIDERLGQGEAPQTYVRRLAMEKSMRALELLEAEAASLEEPVIVLGADTAVVIDGDTFGKPRSDADADAMLRRLSGRRHDVVTGISLRSGPHEVGAVETTVVEFALLGDADRAWYIASGEGRDKAGAYAIQGLAARFIPRIHGSYTNVVGLPVAAVHTLLAEIASHIQSGYSEHMPFSGKSL